MSVARQQRRLPGFRFEAQPPPLREVLPRMDVACFVGFTASGPINRPVAVEAAAPFADIFGEDAPLAWDGRRGERVSAYLGPAVRAFFRNGGRRCWVVRVAGRRARYNYLPVPGLVRLRRDGTLAPAFARARSQGSWSDSLQTSTALLSHPVALARFSSPDDFDLELSAPDEIGAGDLLRFTFGDDGQVLLVVAGSVAPVEDETGSPPGASPPEATATRRAVVRVRGRDPRWFRVPAPPTGASEGEAVVFTPDMRRKRARASVPDGVVWNGDEPVALNLSLAGEDAPPPPGTFVRVDFSNEQLWLVVATATALGDAAMSPPGTLVQVTGEALYWLKGATPASAPSGVPFVERLQFELSVRRGGRDPVRMSDLGFAPDHPRFWGALPTDEEFFAEPATPFETRQRAVRARRADFETKYPTLWRSSAEPRFPVAGRHRFTERDLANPSQPRHDIYFPVAMPALSEAYLPVVKLPATALERDGLAVFDEELFLDPDLKDTSAETLMSQADFLRYQSPIPRQLTGIHAALDIEEATIIAVPDEVHRGWERTTEERIEAGASKPVSHPEWWRHLPCNPPRAEWPQATEPPRDNFLDCDLLVVEAPVLEATEPDNSGTFSLSWTRPASAPPETEEDDGVAYVLEESADANWGDSAVIYRGAETRVTIYGRTAGDYFYRVRAVAGRSSSEWSAGVAVRVSPPGEWRLKRRRDFSAGALLGLQRALLRMCSARGDLLAVLSLPEHYRETETLEHSAALRVQIKPSVSQTVTTAGEIQPLSYAERRALSYGALYHPWLTGREEGLLGELRTVPPAGAACGLIAARSVVRGAWVAPANEPLRGVVALAPPMGRARLLDLQDAQLNIVRQEPRGFLVLNAETLSDDADLRQINVRRLMILLRRLALRLGATYVFEPNDGSFRRLVQRGFEGMLEGMFTRGAFAGRTPATSYRVDTGAPPNTPQSVEQGRFIVELRVAPSQPMTFLTIRLVQIGDRGLAAQER